MVSSVATDMDGEARLGWSGYDIGADEYYERGEYDVYLPLVLRNYVLPVGPDLVITDIATDPASPVAGEEATITVTVKNQGTGTASSWFFIDLYVDPITPPDECTDLGTYYTYGTSDLGPGESYQARFSHMFGNGGAHTLYAQADTYDGFNGSPDYGMIEESNEVNNIYGPFGVSVSGPGTSGEEPTLPGIGPRPTPTAEPE